MPITAGELASVIDLDTKDFAEQRLSIAIRGLRESLDRAFGGIGKLATAKHPPMRRNIKGKRRKK